MTDDLERHLRRDLPTAELPRAPDSLHVRLQAVAASEPRQVAGRAVRRTGRLRLLIGLAAILVVGGAAAVSYVGLRRPNIPTTVDGLPVMTVSEAVAAHAAGRLADGRAAIRGWWSNGQVGHSCVPSIEPVGELELRCQDGEFGITELDEPIFVIDMSSGLVTYEAQGPHLSPYVANELEGIADLFGLPIVNGQRYPPVPILVVGHFDDPRAAQCRAAARQICLDRLVVDRIVEFSPESVPTPGVTVPPTAFPDPPPSPLFDAVACAGDVPYSFVGWTTTAALELPYDRPGHVFAMVTKDPVLLTADGWEDDPNGSGHQFQIWGPKICIAEEAPGHQGEMGFGSVPAGTYVLWDDGLRVPGSDPVRPLGSS